MQSLISEAATLPSMLQQTDQLLASLDEAKAIGLCNSYLGLLSKMQRWEISLQTKDPESLCIRSSYSNSRELASGGHSLWFPNITLANVYTHLWSFRIICALELICLVSLFPSMKRQAFMPSLYLSAQNVQEHTEALAVHICFSMEYLIQDDMRLFGPASTLLPLQSAYRVFIADRHKNFQHIAYIEGVVDRLVEKGIRSAPYLIYS